MRTVEPPASRGARRGSGRAASRSRGGRRALVPPVLAGLLLLWSLSCLAPAAGTLPGPLATLAPTAAGAAPLATVGAVALIALTALRWRSVSGVVTLVVSILAAAVPWIFLVPYGSGSPTLPPGSPVVRAMLVNAHNGRAGARDIAAAATANRIDLLVVTELSGQLAHDLAVAGLDKVVTARWVRVPGQDGAPTDPEAGMGIWSRGELTGVREVTGTQWPAVRASVAGAHPLTVVAGHVTAPVHGGARWAGDLAALRAAGAAETGPLLVLANLNATPWHADFRRFGDAGLIDAADVLGSGLRPTWPSWSPLAVLPLDHALVGGGVDVAAVDTVVIGGSDHRGLIVELRLPG